MFLLVRAIFRGCVAGILYHAVSCCNQGILANCPPFKRISVFQQDSCSVLQQLSPHKIMVVIEEMQFFKSTRLSKPRCRFFVQAHFQWLCFCGFNSLLDLILPGVVILFFHMLLHSRPYLGLRWCIHGVSQPKPAVQGTMWIHYQVKKKKHPQQLEGG